MEVFLERYEEDYEHNLTAQNEDLPVNLEYLNQSKKIFYNKNRRLFECDRNTTLLDYLRAPKPGNPHFLNFTYNNYTYIISYNFPHKTINVYMGRVFNEDDLNWLCAQVPKIEGFKILKNSKESSFRYNTRDTSRKDYSEIITNNIIKFMSNYPIEYQKFVSAYILKSYNFGYRLNLPLQLDALHKNISIFYMSSTFIRSLDTKYLIVLKHFNPSPGLFVTLSLDNILVCIYDWKDEIIKILETPQFELFGVSNISVYILEDKYDLDFDECYNSMLSTIVSLYFQRTPLNNNSPSSE